MQQSAKNLVGMSVGILITGLAMVGGMSYQKVQQERALNVRAQSLATQLSQQLQLAVQQENQRVAMVANSGDTRTVRSAAEPTDTLRSRPDPAQQSEIAPLNQPKTSMSLPGPDEKRVRSGPEPEVGGGGPGGSGTVHSTPDAAGAGVAISNPTRPGLYQTTEGKKIDVAHRLSNLNVPSDVQLTVTSTGASSGQLALVLGRGEPIYLSPNGGTSQPATVAVTFQDKTETHLQIQQDGRVQVTP